MNPFVVWSESVKEVTKPIVEQHPLEQLGVTQDETDYLFYQTEVDAPLLNQSEFELIVVSHKANSLLIFIDEWFLAANNNHDHEADNFTMTFIYIGDMNKKDTI